MDNGLFFHSIQVWSLSGALQSLTSKQKTYSPILIEFPVSHKSEATPSINESIIGIVSDQLLKCLSKSILQH